MLYRNLGTRRYSQLLPEVIHCRVRFSSTIALFYHLDSCQVRTIMVFGEPVLFSSVHGLGHRLVALRSHSINLVLIPTGYPRLLLIFDRIDSVHQNLLSNWFANIFLLLCVRFAILFSDANLTLPLFYLAVTCETLWPGEVWGFVRVRFFLITLFIFVIFTLAVLWVILIANQGFYVIFELFLVFFEAD